MSIATLFLLLLRKRMGLRQREVVVDSVSYDRLMKKPRAMICTLDSFAFFRCFITLPSSLFV